MNRNGLSLAALSIFVLLALGSSDAGDQSDTPAPAHDEVGAYTICQQFITDRLKAPSTADFPWSASEHTVHLGGGKYTVRAYVDAENSFGAKLRNHFVCTVQHAGGDRWQLIDLAMDE
jgi:hypothetical protein